MSSLVRNLPAAARTGERYLAAAAATKDTGPGADISRKEVEDKIRDEVHFAARMQEDGKPAWNMHEAKMTRPVWSSEQVNGVQMTHKPPEGFLDYLALFSVKFIRMMGADVSSGYFFKKNFGTLNERTVLSRAILLETVGGVPGFAGGMTRHLRMEKDQGWIHALLEEAENERMHLITWMDLRKPGAVMRGVVMAKQYVLTLVYSLFYLISPHYCHRFSGYLEEEAIRAYTEILHLIDTGLLPEWKTKPAPEIAIKYWGLDPNAKIRDVVLAIRADEAHHRGVNHTMVDIEDEHNLEKAHHH